MIEQATADLAALRRRMTEQETISREDVRLLFAHIDREAERSEQQGADLTALWVLAERAVDAWSEEDEPTAHDIPMSALAAALGEDHPGAVRFAELQALRADALALRRIVETAQLLRYAMQDATQAHGGRRKDANAWAARMWTALREQLEQTALNEQHPGAALLSAIQGALGAWQRLGRCFDEFLPGQPEACGEYMDLLDGAMIELGRALGGDTIEETHT